MRNTTIRRILLFLLMSSIALLSVKAQAAESTIAFAVFSSNANQSGLFTMQVSGQNRRRIASLVGSPVWSLDGSRIAFAVNDEDIYAINANGSGLEKRFDGEFCKASSFKVQWLLDHQRLAFTQSCDGFTSDVSGETKLFLNTKTRSQLIANWGARLKSNMSLTADGQVSYVLDSALYRSKLDRSDPIQLMSDSEKFDFSTVEWSPDRKKIARIDYITGEKPTQRISIVQTDGKLLAQWNNPGINWATKNLIWSPDSQKVAYYHLESNSLQNIYLFDLQSKTPKALTAKPDEYNYLSWSPDGRQIALTAKTALYVLTLDLATLKNLTPTLKLGSVDEPTWSPDSRQIAFVANQNQHLYLVNRTGTGLRQLTRDQDAVILSLVWRPEKM